MTSFLSAIALWSVPSVAPAQVLYQIDDSDRVANPTSLLGVSVYAATTGGIWRLVDGDTYQMNSGPNENVRSLPDGVSLVSIASTTASTMYAYGSDGLLYQIDDSDRVANPTSLLGASLYPTSQGGIWRLVDGVTYQMNSGPNENVRGLPDGVSLLSISSTTASTMYAHGSDGLLYQIDDSDRIANPTSLLDASFYASTTGGTWRLVDGDTYQMNSGPNENVRGLPDGFSMVSIASTTSSTLYVYVVPEPSTVALLLVGGGVLIFARRRFC